ncbi:MAG TPA: glycosyltransferase [Anaerolineales bacterium]|nr:glycosyltransferase [Anaerolineales bacterium]
MSPLSELDLNGLREQVVRLGGHTGRPPDASIVIPVNAQGDLENVLHILVDITRYTGTHSLEIILVINNYPPEAPPSEVETYRSLGLKVVSIPNVRRPGEAVGFTARLHGVQAAASEMAILFDADCRLPHPTALIDWYVHQFKAGAQAAYTHVDYYNLRGHWSIRARILIHHLARWIKRFVLRIPTTRGSNYAVHRSLMLDLYDKGILADELNVGPAFKSVGGRVAYSGSKELIVLTSGRMFTGGWRKMLRYLRYRLLYNLRVLPVRLNVARYTKRERDPVRTYINNQPRS